MKVTVAAWAGSGRRVVTEGSERFTEVMDCKQLWFMYPDKNSRLHLRWKICFFYSKLYFSLNHQIWLLSRPFRGKHTLCFTYSNICYFCRLFLIPVKKGHFWHSMSERPRLQNESSYSVWDESNSDCPHSKPIVSWFEWLPRFHFFPPSVLFHLSLSGSRGAGAYRSCLRARGGVQPGQGASLSQGCHTDTDNHSNLWAI